ncbi:short-chain dehydrogenase [Secundilactobacillus paracollinoides]|uniref:Short-chain dehydrogenase n=1 Tax=Secundilactobacillus paracollinoides TaxID=240427 RepID=A0A1B2IV50_9LACO|nr:SDR family NAD(P)-dependent oxidoreductase [Secundilactobacillus paracollinoides]ANZ60128.1 short-chain dehydrogenase [Secundilactobacillus paracollinoides]ANZ62918.1 short-chain dehydrogenase [Secundilactobacillus paracollinoides]ANZ65922.1 short-chain dehydrogenase [Secundilactobacillus paracollinoides]KRL78392.1 short-chain dehydrogenase reductase SDR [Secundilactobacillus paracollinoides DSM 15502 = JCM 11969]
MTQTVLISGANRGIGLEVATQLAQQGNQVIIGARQQAAGEKTVADLVASGIDGSQLDSVQLDVTDDASVTVAAAEIRQSHPDLDLLVNNAGIAGDMTKPALATTAADYAATLEVNFYGSLRMIQAFMPILETNNGQIANITGLGTPSVFYNPAAYSVSKATLNALIQSLAVDIVKTKRPVSIYGIFPGGVSTDINNHMEGPFMKTLAEGSKAIVDILTDEQPHNGEILGSDGQVLSSIERQQR